MGNSFFSSIIQIALLSLLFSGCADLLMNRTFIDEMDRDTDQFFVANRDFDVVPGDSGNGGRTKREILLRTPASEKMKKKRDNAISLERELLEKEARLQEHEHRDYVRNDRYFSNISERIYYLDLQFEARQDYIATKRGRDNYAKNLGAIDLIRNPTYLDRELYLGMNKESVLETWGRPSNIDIAGNPANQNERWSFYTNGPVRTVFFENGVVQGWVIE